MVERLKIKKELLQYSMLYDFRAGLKAAESYRRLCKAFVPDVVSNQTVNNWFKHFKSVNYSIEDETRSGRPSELDNQALQQLVESNPRQTTYEIAEILNCDHSFNYTSTFGRIG